MSAFHLPAALVVARRARQKGEKPDPQVVWELCDGDAELMVHAMVEAGHIFPKGSDSPYASCPYCGWSP